MPASPPDRPQDKIYREVPYIFIAPGHRGIGNAASEVFDEHYDDLWDLRHNVAIMGQGLDVDHDSSRGELLSYLFFDKHFGSELVDLGGDGCDRLDSGGRAGPRALVAYRAARLDRPLLHDRQRQIAAVEQHRVDRR